jgi:hypothetical protein
MGHRRRQRQPWPGAGQYRVLTGNNNDPTFAERL